ncbi:MAG: hypothetical protein EB120_14105 [Proteobacteria bacterium]|nr:hypothetical protein [Pseudomonadota bacterium]NDG28295.1 hypothetical protein [Pseudomonadota bacterium]
MGTPLKTQSLWLGVIGLVAWGLAPSSIALGDGVGFLPTLRHVRVLRSRGDCSIYGAVKAKTEARYRELSLAESEIKEIAKQRREALVKCGASSEDSRRALQEEELADQCPTEYGEWIRSGESYLANQVELKDTYRNLKSLSGLIAYYCGKLPPEPSSVPAEKSD